MNVCREIDELSVVPIEILKKIEDAHFHGESQTTEEGLMDELQIEWGLTDEEFDSIAAEKIERIISIRNAQNRGNARRASYERNKNILKK